MLDPVLDFDEEQATGQAGLFIATIQAQVRLSRTVFPALRHITTEEAEKIQPWDLWNLDIEIDPELRTKEDGSVEQVEQFHFKIGVNYQHWSLGSNGSDAVSFQLWISAPKKTAGSRTTPPV